jgi:threonine/homoserine/homoserine lactone efflux protein
MNPLIFPLLAFLLPLAYSPGPGNMFFAALGARFGMAATLPANAGYHIATLLVTGCIGAGLVSVLDPGSRLFFILKTAGSLYVLWLAWRMATSGRADTGSAVRGAGFLDGVWLLILNPKAYLIILLMYSQFGGLAAAGEYDHIAMIALVFTLNNFLAFLLWTLAGDTLGRLFRNDACAQRLNRGFALLLASVALWRLLK